LFRPIALLVIILFPIAVGNAHLFYLGHKPGKLHPLIDSLGDGHVEPQLLLKIQSSTYANIGTLL
jgi:hypothetical protein